MCVHRVAAMGSVVWAAVLVTGCPKSHPSPAPQGKIAFVSEDRDQNCAIWVMNVDGTQPTQLTDDGDYPVWSPDGRRIAFLAGRVNAQYELYVMNVDGSDQRKLVEFAIDPVWSHDGRTIACVHQGDGVEARVYTVSPEGGDPVPRTADGAGSQDSDPSWSPDGRQIAYCAESWPDGWYDIFVVNADGTERH